MTLQPFIRLLLRYGIGYGEFAQVCKEVYVEVADTDFRIANRKQTVSRISVLTGITRREIKHIREMMQDTSREYFPYNHAARILSSWTHDPEFQNDDGSAAALTATTEGDGTFNKLVHKYGNNTPYRAILDELVRVGAVSVNDEGVARMVSTGYVPGKDSQELLSVALQSVADHISTIDFNDIHKPDTSRLQLTVNYDNVTDDGVEVFRQVSREKSKEILMFLDRFLATQDRDSNPTIDGSGRNRTGLGIFYFENKHDPESDS
ncbi:MAG: DUF6502 family protein [Granulosicoccus sp.]